VYADSFRRIASPASELNIVPFVQAALCERHNVIYARIVIAVAIAIEIDFFSAYLANAAVAHIYFCKRDRKIRTSVSIYSFIPSAVVVSFPAALAAKFRTMFRPEYLPALFAWYLSFNPDPELFCFLYQRRIFFKQFRAEFFNLFVVCEFLCFVLLFPVCLPL
jgi:hypothetical protein